jgi:hypothetical protein
MMPKSAREKFLILALFGVVFYVLYLFKDNPNVSQHINFSFMQNDKCGDYRRSCMQLFKKLRYPNKSLIIYPPLKEPPADMLLNFTQNGEMPLRRLWYFNDATQSKNDIIGFISNKEIENWRLKVRKGEPLKYEDVNLRGLMYKYSQYIKNQYIAVIGTTAVWIESIAVELEAKKIYTLDYTRNKYESSQLEWVHVFDYLDNAIKQGLIEDFDTSVSFSSIEHSGLGRFGDPLDPYGDLEAVKQVHCMLKPNGIFFLGLPTTGNENSYLEFNAYRIYGPKRFKLIFDGWQQLDKSTRSADGQEVFMLKKISPCEAS